MLNMLKNETFKQDTKSTIIGVQVGFPMDRLAIDVMGPLPVSKSNNKYILVIGDYFTRWMEAFALPHQQAELIASILVKEFISRWGVPVELHSDQARNFESDLLKHVCKLLDIRKTRTTPYHPSANGMIERMNRSLNKMICSFVNSNKNDWDEYLPSLMSAYRGSIHPAPRGTVPYGFCGKKSACMFSKN